MKKIFVILTCVDPVYSLAWAKSSEVYEPRDDLKSTTGEHISASLQSHQLKPMSVYDSIVQSTLRCLIGAHRRLFVR